MNTKPAGSCEGNGATVAIAQREGFLFYQLLMQEK
jgi:hypothetical protein